MNEGKKSLSDYKIIFIGLIIIFIIIIFTAYVVGYTQAIYDKCGNLINYDYLCF